MAAAKSLPRRVVRRIRLWRDLIKVFSYDAVRFVRYSGVLRKQSHAPSMGALITKQYHRIEKGLALPTPRPGFGEVGIKELCALVEDALRRRVCLGEVALAVDSLAGYNEFNRRHGIDAKPWILSALESAAHAGIHPGGSPTKEATSPALDSSDALQMIVSRASVRDFSDEPVPREVLDNAVRAAQYAPCVCNRQSGRVHLLLDEATRKKALQYQNGNRGFGDSARAVAIITVDQAEMLEPTERYQHWIDGGMFAQNFLLGIHAQGYGACPLNWSASIEKDRDIRDGLGIIKNSETIIMLVAIGALKPQYSIARSERRDITEVANIV